jgi:sugar (pentulose or hexulose) kinase
MTVIDSSAIPSRRADIEAGRTALGIEFGSTRIKAVLVDRNATPLASGGHTWENRLVDGVWSYDLEDVWAGLRAAYADLAAHVRQTYGEDAALRTVGSIGISAMMHGYLALDADGGLLVPFRTWRNTSTAQASRALTELLRVNIPQRWSVAHLYQAILGGEEHVSHIARLTTLAGLVHLRLTGRHVLGVGDASGMFPIGAVGEDAGIDEGGADASSGSPARAAGTPSSHVGYDREGLARFDDLIADRGLPWRVEDLLPEVLSAGEDAGSLTREGAALLDPTGTLRPGIPLAPPEGDAGTGMVATNSVAPRTGNVSSGTSVFAMVVLERALRGVHEELDPVTTPDGHPVAMVHCNNGTSELDAWVGLFREFADLAGADIAMPRVYDLLYDHAADHAEADAGGLLAYNLLSGEPVVGLAAGRPLVLRAPGSRLTLANFMRAQLMTVFASLRIGMDILLDEEGVGLDRLFAHGGLFKTPRVAQGILATALDTPVIVSSTAGEGGAWGMAVLALYRAAQMGALDEGAPADRSDSGRSEPLPDFLDARVFTDAGATTTMAPDPAALEGFERFMERYRAGLAIERAAIEHS